MSVTACLVQNQKSYNRLTVVDRSLSQLRLSDIFLMQTHGVLPLFHVSRSFSPINLTLGFSHLGVCYNLVALLSEGRLGLHLCVSH